MTPQNSLCVILLVSPYDTVFTHSHRNLTTHRHAEVFGSTVRIRKLTLYMFVQWHGGLNAISTTVNTQQGRQWCCVLRLPFQTWKRHTHHVYTGTQPYNPQGAGVMILVARQTGAQSHSFWLECLPGHERCTKLSTVCIHMYSVCIV